jgi:hypothetical protein
LVNVLEGAFDFELSENGADIVAHMIHRMKREREATSAFAVSQRLSWEGNW